MRFWKIFFPRGWKKNTKTGKEFGIEWKKVTILTPKIKSVFLYLFVCATRIDVLVGMPGFPWSTDCRICLHTATFQLIKNNWLPTCIVQFFNLKYFKKGRYHVFQHVFGQEFSKKSHFKKIEKTRQSLFTF